MQNPDKPEDEWAEELLEWIDGDFDPAYFNLEKINKQLGQRS